MNFPEQCTEQVNLYNAFVLSASSHMRWESIPQPMRFSTPPAWGSGGGGRGRGQWLQQSGHSYQPYQQQHHHYQQQGNYYSPGGNNRTPNWRRYQ